MDKSFKEEKTFSVYHIRNCSQKYLVATVYEGIIHISSLSDTTKDCFWEFLETKFAVENECPRASQHLLGIQSVYQELVTEKNNLILNLIL